MEINIHENHSNFKDDIKKITKKCINPTFNCHNFRSNMDDFLCGESLYLTYVGYFYGDGLDISMVTNDGTIHFNGDQPSMAELECSSNFEGAMSKYYSEYEEFVKCFHSEYDVNDENIENSFENAFKAFMQDLFVTLSNSSDISIDCQN